MLERDGRRSRWARQPLTTEVVEGRGAASLRVPGRRPSCRRSRKETAEVVGVAPETISVWKRHPHWQLEVERWRELAEAPLEGKQLRLQLESAEATIEALEQLRLIMGSATKRVRTSSGVKEEPNWPTRLKACRLVLAAAFAAVPGLRGYASQAPAAGRTLRIVP